MRFAAFVFLAVPLAWGQQAISARSGLVHKVVGQTSVSGPDKIQKAGTFWEVKPGQILSTQEGHAEILLNPGVFLRLDANSAFRMIDNSLTDSHIELTQGRAMVEAVEIAKGNQVTIHMGKAAFRPTKAGLYLIDAERQEAKVFDGTLAAQLDATNLQLGRGKMATVGALLLPGRFNRKETDRLYAWSSRRSGEIAQANLYVASSIGQTRSKPVSGMSGLWSYLPSLGMFTYLPTNGRAIHNPFGFYYYSPYYIWNVYNRPSMPAYGNSMAAENASWGGSRPSAATYSAPAAIAASSGNVTRSAASAPAPTAGGARGR